VSTDDDYDDVDDDDDDNDDDGGIRTIDRALSLPCSVPLI